MVEDKLRFTLVVTFMMFGRSHYGDGSLGAKFMNS